MFASRPKCEVVLDGAVQSLVDTTYWGWQVGGSILDLISELSIPACSRATTHRLQIKGETTNLCTGIVKNPAAASFVWTGRGQYGYPATYRRQSLAGDSLGLAIFFCKKDLVGFVEDKYSHVVVLRPEGGWLTYYFLAAWEQEPGGVKTRAEFVADLEGILLRLEHPIVVE